jgi:3-keto-5-aminohexanoate cleavage enzyme
MKPMSEFEFDERGFTRKMPAPYFPIEKEHKMSTLNNPVILESAFPGWIPPALNPNIPIKTEEISREIIASIQEGATAIHVHPRDPKDGGLRVDAELMKETLDPVLAKHPDIITWNHSWTGKPNEPVDYKTHTLELLKLGGGPKYVQCAVVLIRQGQSRRGKINTGDIEAIKEGIPFLEENGIKPVFQLYDTFSIDVFVHEIVETGLARWKPYMCCLHMGKHDATYIGKDPWAHMQLITSLNALKAAIPDCVTGLRAGGRNWLPITLTGLTLGIDMVGVGMEDCLWMYPHKDEIIKKNSEVIRKVVTVIRELGREVASSEQAREMLALKKPS